MRCRQCGAENPDWTSTQKDLMRFCVSCGAQLDHPSDAAPQQPERRRASSAPNLKFGGDLAPAPTLGAAYTPAPTRPTTPPPAPTRPTPTPPAPTRSTDEIYTPKPKPKKRGSGKALLILALLLLPVIYLMLKDSKPEEFAYEELRITLKSGFNERDAMTNLQNIDFTKAHVDYTLDNGTDSVFIYRDDKLANSFASLGEYAEYTKNLYPDGTGAFIRTRDQYRYFIATGESSGSDQNRKVLVALYESDDAFWTVEISMFENQFDEDQALEWADSVTFDE